MASPASRRACAAAVAVFLAAGCDLTWPWSSGTTPDAPSGLRATAWDPLDIDPVLLTWNPVTGAEYYEVQGRIAGGDWLTIGWAPPTATGTVVSLDPALPELTPLAFRVRVTVYGATSDWSGEAGFVRGIRPPSTFAAELPIMGSGHYSPVRITWTNASQVATQLELERSPLGGGNATAWTPVAGAALAAGAYADDVVDEGVAYAYRARVGAGSSWSGYRSAQTEVVDIAAPSGLRAFVDGDVVRLTWTNRSATAEKVVVTRSMPSWGTGFELPPTTTAWSEPMPVWPVASYTVSAMRPSVYYYASTDPVRLEPFTLAGPPALAASAQLLPQHEYAVRDAAGRLHLAHEIYDTPRIHRATDAGYDTHLLPGDARLAPPGLLLDGQGAPHAVYLLGPAAYGGPTELRHAWWDGSAWQDESVVTDDVAPWVSNQARAWFGLDDAGAVQVLYRRTAATGEDLVHVARLGGTWASDLVTTPSVPDFSRWSAAFAVARDGSAYVAMLGQSLTSLAYEMVLCKGAPGGAWSDELAPAGDVSLNGPYVVGGNGGDAAVGYFAGLGDVQVVRRQGGTWGAPELVATRELGGYEPTLRIAATPDLGKLAVVAATSGRVGVHVEGGTGWQRVEVGPGSEVWGSLGVDASGRTWALFAHDSAASSGQPLPYSLFEEGQ